MILVLHQFLSVVLTMDVNQIGTKLPEDRGGNRLHINAADASSGGSQFPLDMNRILLFPFQSKFDDLLAQFGCNLIKHGTDKAFFRPASNQLTAGSLSHQCTDGVDDDGFAGAGLACQHSKSRLKCDIRPLDDSDILNMQ